MLPARVAQTIRDRAIFQPGERVLVAVSGGPDSIALLSILRDLIPTLAFRLSVAHFDHGWRPDSAQDARHVQELASRWGYRVIVAQAPPDLPHTEDAARNARYRFLRHAAAEENCTAIALGHTQDDQVETVLLHLLRGSGTHGLAGMRHRSGDLARPLLGISRAEVEAYLTQRHLSARHDPTNESLTFTRNRLRHTLLPALDAFDPAARRLLARTADVLAEDDNALEQQVNHLPADLIDNAAAFRRLPVGIQRRLIQRFNPGRNFAEIEDIRRRASSGAASAAGTLSTGASIGAAGVAPSGSASHAADRSLRVRSCSCDPSTFKARDTVGHIDAGTIAPPLHIQTRHAGDRVQPLGFTHPKKLQDVLVDAHVPRHLRDTLPIVRDQHGIVWIPGVTVAETHRVTPATREQLHLEIVTG